MLLLCLTLGLPGVVPAAWAIPPGAAYRISDVVVDRWAGFDIAVDEQRDVIHFVYRELKSTGALAMHHITSGDGGLTWSDPVLIDAGHQVDLALDSQGDLHLVYGNKGSDRYPGNVQYRRFSNGQWSASKVLASNIENSVRVFEMRIALDGNNNAHVIYHDHGPQKFYPGTTTDNWEDDRVVYQRCAPGGAWTAPERWKGDLPDEGALGGDMFVDAAGDVHFVILAGSSTTWKMSIERKTVSKSGQWSATVDYPNFKVGNGMHEKFGGQIAPNGWLYLGGISSSLSGVAVWAFQDDLGTAPASLFNDPINTRSGVDLLLDPSGNGDIWVAVGNWKITPGDEDYQRGFYYHYSAAADSWSEKTQLSAPSVANTETFWDTTPKLRAYKGQVYLFYSEKAPGEQARFYFNVFGDPAGPAPAGDGPQGGVPDAATARADARADAANLRASTDSAGCGCRLRQGACDEAWGWLLVSLLLAGLRRGARSSRGSRQGR